MLKDEERTVQQQIAGFEQRTETAPRRQQEFQRQARDYATTKELYQSLLKRYEDAQIAESMEQGQKSEQFRVLDAAVPAKEPFAPNRMRLGLLAVALSLGAGALVAMLRERIDTSFHTRRRPARLQPHPRDHGDPAPGDGGGISASAAGASAWPRSRWWWWSALPPAARISSPTTASSSRGSCRALDRSAPCTSTSTVCASGPSARRPTRSFSFSPRRTARRWRSSSTACRRARASSSSRARWAPARPRCSARSWSASGRAVRHVAFIFDSTMSYDGLVEYMLEDFGIPSAGATRAQRLVALNRFLIERRRAGQTAAVIVDEAQNLSLASLEHLRLLSNFETPTGKLLQIILVGQPELRDKLARPELRQLRQRLGMRCAIRPLTPEETRAISGAASTSPARRDTRLFTDTAVKRIAAYTSGIPRLVNILCDHCLLIGYTEQTRRVERGMVERAIEYLEDGKRPAHARGMFWPPATRRLRWLVGGLGAAAIAGVTLLAAAVVGVIRAGPDRRSIPRHTRASRATW